MLLSLGLSGCFWYIFAKNAKFALKGCFYANFFINTRPALQLAPKKGTFKGKRLGVLMLSNGLNVV